MTLTVHEAFLHARSAARYAAIEALAGHPVRAREWLLVMDEYANQPAAFGEGRAIDVTFETKPDSRMLLRTEKAAALYALGSHHDAFEELWAVVQARPDYLRAQRGIYDVATRLLEGGSRDPRVETARRRAAQVLSARPGP